MDALTLLERSRLTDCEAVIERGLKTFVDVGQALLEIRDGTLYRQEYSTFEEYCEGRWNISQRHGLRLVRAAETVGYLKSGPIGPPLPKSESQARPLTRLEPEQQREAWAEAVDTAPNGKVTAAHVQSVVDTYIKPRPHVTNNSGNNEWYTPPEYIAAARAVMGDIDLDPASSDLANNLVQAGEYFTAEDDGLSWDWHGRVWMNPPYSQPIIGEFCQKFVDDYTQGFITEGCVLVNNATDTRWYHALLEHAAAVCFVLGRIRFIDENGEPSGAPLQGQTVLYFGEAVDKFAAAFSQFGRVLYGERRDIQQGPSATN